MNWTVSEVKQRGKETMKAGYWMCVLVSLILLAVTGGLGGISGGINGLNSGLNASKMNQTNTTEAINSLDITEDMDEMTAAMSEMITDGTLFAIIGIVLAIFLVIFAISFLIAIFLIEPLMVGCMRFFTVAGRERNYEIGTIGFSFTHNYINIVKVMFFMEIKILLWSLLLIIPGIIKSYEYRMIPYILGDNSDIDSNEAFRMSKEMMDGNKWHAFLLDLSFIGWIILDILTCGILGVFWVNPYIYATYSELYLTISGAARTYGETGTGAGFNDGASYEQPSYSQPSYEQPSQDMSHNIFDPSSSAGDNKDNPFNTPY